MVKTDSTWIWVQTYDRSWRYDNNRYRDFAWLQLEEKKLNWEAFRESQASWWISWRYYSAKWWAEWFLKVN